MKSFSTYINDGEYSESFINESLENNRRIINESVFVHDHYNDINMFMNKFRTYAFNNLYNPNAINESADTYRLTTNESYAFRDFMIYICEEYRSKLLNELNIYESLIVDGELISEGKFWDKLKGGIGKVYQYSKEKIASAIDYVKTKIKEVNDLIREFANKAITSVKDMAGKLVGLLAKFNCTLEGLFKKMGFYSEKSEESVMQIGNELAKNTKENPDTITDNDVITENMQNNFSITLQHVYEDVENLEDTKAQGETVQQAKKKGIKQALWEGFKQLMIWAGTCVVLPGFICAIFPGTFIALLVPLACKLLWNAYKIYKMIKQWKKVRQEWKTYKKVQKWITAIGMAASIIAIIFNFNSVFSSIGKVWDALQESGGNLLAQANIGIQPDVLTRGFAALLRMIKEGKFSFEDFGQSFQEITDSFAQHTQISINTMVKRVSDTAKNIEAAKEAFIKGDYTKSMQAINKIKDAYGMSAEAFDKVPIDANVSIFADGSIGNNEWTRRAMKVLNCKTIDELYDKLSGERLVNKGLEAISHGKGGSMTIFNMTKETYLKLRESGLFGAHNINFPIGVVSETTSLLTTTMDVVTAATSMLVTIPSVEFAPQNNGGFRVRLGGPKDKDNFVYEVGKDDIKTHKVSDYQKQYDVIKDKIAEVNKQFVDTIIKNDKISKDKKQKIMDTLEEFNNTYKENINTLDCVVFYGRDVTENTTNESYRSLYNYMINEAKDDKISDKTITALTDTLLGLVSMLCKIYNVSNLMEIKPDTLNGDLKDFYNSSVKSFINGLNTFQKYLVDNDIKIVDNNDKLALDFGSDTSNLQNHYKKLVSIFKTKIIKDIYNETDTLKKLAGLTNTTIIDIIKKIFNGDSLSDNEIQNVIIYLKSKFNALNDDDIKEIINKIIDLSNKTKDEQTNESLDYEPVLILEGITNKNILNSLDNICKWFSNELSTTISDKDAANIDWKKLAAKIEERTLKDAIKKIFSRDKFKDPKLGKDFIHNASLLLYKRYDINYDDAAELITSIHKLYTVCSQQNKDIKDADKTNNNDITNEQKLLYNHIIELLRKIDDFNRSLNNKDIDILKSIKIKSEDKETKDFKNTVVQVKKEIKQEKPKHDETEIKNTNVNDIIDNIKQLIHNDNNVSDDDLMKIYQKMIKIFLKDKKFKNDVNNKEYDILPGINIEESLHKNRLMLFEKLNKNDFKNNLKKLKNYLLKQLKQITQDDVRKLSKDNDQKLLPVEPQNDKKLLPVTTQDMAKTLELPYEPEKITNTKSDNVVTSTLPVDEPIKKLPYIDDTDKKIFLPDTSDSSNTNNTDDSSDTSSKSSDNSSEPYTHNDKEVPVLMIANNYCIDLADATKSGPRPDAYSLKGIFDSLTFTMIEGGTSVTNITKMLGEILNSQTSQLWTVIANKPCKRENNKSKYELETYNDANLERPDFGMLTNEEITELLNKPKTAENIIKSKTNNVAIAKTPQDKEMLANTKKEFTDALDKPDDKTIELVKNIDPDAIDKDGHINQDSIEEISDKASQYELAKYQAENTPKKGGLFSKLKNFVRNLFGGNKSEGSAISKLAKYLRSKSKGVNESLYDDDLFLEQCFARKSFKEYINESMN